VNRKLPSRRGELESIFRGIRFAVVCIFALPVIVSAFILTAALLNAGQSLTTVLLPGSYWLALLSFAFRISLIPGFAYLTYRAVSRLHDRCGEKRFVVVLSSLMLLTVYVLMPARPQARLASPEATLKSQRFSRSHLQSGRLGEACARKDSSVKAFPPKHQGRSNT
jgi:hypothetical protein